MSLRAKIGRHKPKRPIKTPRQAPVMRLSYAARRPWTLKGRKGMGLSPCLRRRSDRQRTFQQRKWTLNRALPKTHLQSEKKAKLRLSCPDEDQKRPPDHQPQTPQGPRQAFGVNGHPIILRSSEIPLAAQVPLARPYLYLHTQISFFTVPCDSHIKRLGSYRDQKFIRARSTGR